MIIPIGRLKYVALLLGVGVVCFLLSYVLHLYILIILFLAAKQYLIMCRLADMGYGRIWGYLWWVPIVGYILEILVIIKPGAVPSNIEMEYIDDPILPPDSSPTPRKGPVSWKGNKYFSQLWGTTTGGKPVTSSVVRPGPVSQQGY